MRRLFSKARNYTAESNIHVRAVRLEAYGHVLPAKYKHVRDAARLTAEVVNSKNIRVIAPNGMRLNVAAAKRCTC